MWPVPGEICSLFLTLEPHMDLTLYKYIYNDVLVNLHHEKNPKFKGPFFNKSHPKICSIVCTKSVFSLKGTSAWNCLKNKYYCFLQHYISCDPSNISQWIHCIASCKNIMHMLPLVMTRRDADWCPFSTFCIVDCFEFQLGLTVGVD